jgi:hypothetical protein
MKYTLELSRTQCQVLVSALDNFSRLGMGQFYTVVSEHIPRNFRSINMQEVNDMCDKLKLAVHSGLDTNAYHGIHSGEISDYYRVAWDLHQVIRHRISWDEHPEGGMTVNFDTPMRSSEKEELAKIEQVK